MRCERRPAAAARLIAAVSARFFGALAFALDLLPPRWRYGHARRVTTALFRASIRSVQETRRTGLDAPGPPLPESKAELTCAILCARLDVGGIGSVVEILALRLSAHGIRAIIVCDGDDDGTRARRLRERGVEVHAATDIRSAADALSRAQPDVIQLHYVAPPYLERVAIHSGVPVVAVLHNTEIHYSKERWREFSAQLSGLADAVAVSETVREFHSRHVPPELRSRIAVIPNGVPPHSTADAGQRTAARRMLGEALACDLEEDIVFLCLGRYDPQKNVAGTVASFLRALDEGCDGSVRLVFAGEPSDWVEFRRADAIRRAHLRGDRIHLLGNSDAGVLLDAADSFLMNSFFEGWPVAATEALAAGLPLLLSDSGGARELVARRPERSILVSNACGDPATVSDASVRAARRRSHHQSNSAALATAIEKTAFRLRDRRGEHDGIAAHDAGADGCIAEMVAAHAAALRAAAKRTSA
ncbi:glycosyltransferase [Microbacterium sp. 18062]|uniref:glycosyltransferase n=1 Tax=Microbacterium sp. 18062 TaxID=2681410 RepID=UPI00135BE4A2|nr:glycosyltransferase [Microbacterium sp. 18062]